jgi:DNA-binding response OmpR family regulator
LATAVWRPHARTGAAFRLLATYGRNRRRRRRRRVVRTHSLADPTIACNGYQTVRSWRERGLLTPVLALTADTTAENVERCLAACCNGHLTKPIAPALLQRSLAMHLPAATTS